MPSSLPLPHFKLRYHTAQLSYLFVYEASCFGDFLPWEKGNREKKSCITNKCQTLLPMLLNINGNGNIYIVCLSKAMLQSFSVNTGHKMLVLIQNFNEQRILITSPLFEEVFRKFVSSTSSVLHCLTFQPVTQVWRYKNYFWVARIQGKITH